MSCRKPRTGEATHKHVEHKVSVSERFLGRNDVQAGQQRREHDDKADRLVHHDRVERLESETRYQHG